MTTFPLNKPYGASLDTKQLVDQLWMRKPEHIEKNQSNKETPYTHAHRNTTEVCWLPGRSKKHVISIIFRPNGLFILFVWFFSPMRMCKCFFFPLCFGLALEMQNDMTMFNALSKKSLKDQIKGKGLLHF